MKGPLTFCCMLLAVAGVGGRAWAEEGAAPKPADQPRRDFAQERFKAMDTDTNGVVSLAEFTVAHDKRQEEMKKRQGDKYDASKYPSAAEAFKKMDANGDGSLTIDELKKPREGQRPAGEGGKHHGPPPGGKKDKQAAPGANM